MNKNILNKNILVEQCLNMLNTKEVQDEIKNILKPLFKYIFDELALYFYIFVFIIFSSFFINLGVLALLVRYNNKIKFIKE